jgi:hypothetical protein
LDGVISKSNYITLNDNINPHKFFHLQ